MNPSQSQSPILLSPGSTHNSIPSTGSQSDLSIQCTAASPSAVIDEDYLNSEQKIISSTLNYLKNCSFK